MFDLEQTIRERHSIRLFLSQPVPPELVSGPARERLVHALLDAAQKGPPNIPPLPESFKHFHSELGAQVYGAMGIPREDKAGHCTASCGIGSNRREPCRTIRT